MFATLTLITLALVAQPEAAPADAAPADAAGQTQRLFGEADARYQTSDYNGAVAAFTEAFTASQAIEDDELRGRVQAAILFNLGRAHLEAYRTDQRAEHLRQAIDLFEKYLAQTADLDDRVDAEQRLADARALLDAVAAPTNEPEPTAEPDPEPIPEPEPTRDRISVAGYATLGLAAVGVGVLGAGIGLAGAAQRDYDAGPTREIRTDAVARGGVGNAMIIAGGAFAGAMVVTGVALIGAGKSKQRRNVALVPVPMLGRTSLGISLWGSF